MTKIYSCVLILLPELEPRHFLGRQSLMKKNQLNKNLTVDVYKDPLRKYVIRKTQFPPPPAHCPSAPPPPPYHLNRLLHIIGLFLCGVNVELKSATMVNC